MHKKILLLTFIIVLLVPLAGHCTTDTCIGGTALAKRGMELFDKDREQGLAALIQGARLCPDHSAINYNLGLAQYQYGSISAAFATWNGLLAKGGDSRNLYANASWAAFRLKQFENSLVIARKGLAKYSDDPNLLDTVVQVLFGQGEFQEAYEFLTRSTGDTMPLLRTQAAAYTAAAVQQRFKGNDRDGALQEAVLLVQAFPGEQAFVRVQENILKAMYSSTPLPTIDLPEDNASGHFVSVNDASLDRAIHDLGTPDSAIQRGNGYALIIGVSRYRNIKGPAYAARDARLVHELLWRRGRFKNDQGHVRLLVDNQADNSRISDGLNWLLEKARLDPDAWIFFYFSGHGAPVIQPGKAKVTDGLLLPHDVPGVSISNRTALSVNWLRDRFSELKNEQVIAVVDACFTGEGRSHSSYKGAYLVPELPSKKGKPFMVAAGQTAAEEFIPGRQGAFTYFLLEAMLGRGNDANQDGWIDSREAFDHARTRLTDLGRSQDPRFSPAGAVPLVRLTDAEN